MAVADDENERPRKQVVEVWRGSKGFNGVCVCLRERERKRERERERKAERGKTREKKANVGVGTGMIKMGSMSTECEY